MTPHTDHPMRHYDRTCSACNEMPPLPEPFFGMTGFVRLNAPYSPAFSTYQMTEYGKLCREAALEEAAVLAEAAFKPAKDCYEIADEIRGLK